MPHSSTTPVRRRPAGGRAVRAALLALVVPLLAACGPGDQDAVTPQRYVDPPEVSVAAQELYGQDAEQAYDQIAQFLLDHSYELPLVDPEHTSPTAEELSGPVAPVLTEEAATAWTELVDQDLAGDAEARDVVRLLRFHSWEADGSTLASQDEPVRFQTITEGLVDVAAAPSDGSAAPLTVELVHRADVQLEEARVPYDVVLTKPLTFTLVPGPEGSDPAWLVSTFEGLLEVEIEGSDTEEETGDDPDELPVDGDGASTTG